MIDPGNQNSNYTEELQRHTQRIENLEAVANQTGNSPKAKQVSGDIGWAVYQLSEGRKVTRRGWNGKGMSLGLQVPDAQSRNTLPYVYIITADRKRVPWLCSQTDLLAFDWEIMPVD